MLVFTRMFKEFPMALPKDMVVKAFRWVSTGWPVFAPLFKRSPETTLRGARLERLLGGIQ